MAVPVQAPQHASPGCGVPVGPCRGYRQTEDDELHVRLDATTRACAVRALRLHGPRQAALVEIDEPSPGAGEVVVRIDACGVCGSDLNAWRGGAGIQYPLPPGAPGHEVVGEVVALG